MIIIGVDPDSEKHGVAIYDGRELCDLATLNTVDLVLSCVEGQPQMPLFSIENVCANNFIYARNNKGSRAVQAKIGMSVGRCQQAQIELQRWLDKYECPYVLHKPQRGNWADNKPAFVKATGWAGRSNGDTRSAAYFGWLAARSQ